MSILFRSYGTHYLEDLLIICFGQDYTNNYVLNGNIKYELLKNYVHPISYKVMNWTKNNKNNKNKKTLKKNRIVEDFMIMETAENLDCFDLMRTSKNFNSRVYGIKIIIQNLEQNKLQLQRVSTTNIPTDLTYRKNLHSSEIPVGLPALTQFWMFP